MYSFGGSQEWVDRERVAEVESNALPGPGGVASDRIRLAMSWATVTSAAWGSRQAAGVQHDCWEWSDVRQDNTNRVRLGSEYVANPRLGLSRLSSTAVLRERFWGKETRGGQAWVGGGLEVERLEAYPTIRL